jgi:hypothetical protein
MGPGGYTAPWQVHIYLGSPHKSPFMRMLDHSCQTHLERCVSVTQWRIIIMQSVPVARIIILNKIPILIVMSFIMALTTQYNAILIFFVSPFSIGVIVRVSTMMQIKWPITSTIRTTIILLYH